MEKIQPTVFHGGKVYLVEEYNTTAKFNKLPEPVKKAIQGDKYVEPTQVVEEPATEE